MALETDLNVNPYYDDFDENKNFNRILFKPAVPLQARELTQLQSILQNQIERFGSHIFKEGSIIKGCNFNFDTKLKYAKINDKDTNNQDVVMSLFGRGDFARNQANLVARIDDTATGLETQSPNLNTLFFHYLNVGTGGESIFAESETLDIFPASAGITSVTVSNTDLEGYSNDMSFTVTTDGGGTGFAANIVTIAAGTKVSSINVTANGTGFTPDDNTVVTLAYSNGEIANTLLTNNFVLNLEKLNTVTIANSSFEVSGNIQFNSVGNAHSMQVSDGIIFQRGHFQRFEEQQIVVSKYTNYPDNLTVGVTTNEAIVNSASDTSLLDNASGFNNYNAPGADRLKLTPTLVVNSTTDAEASNNFLSMVQFEGGRPVQLNQKAQLNRLGDEIARRTYEESGDYVLQPFSLATQGISGNTEYLMATVGAGVAYNLGHRTEIFNTKRILLPKATVTNTVVDQAISLNYGNYIKVDNVYGDFGFSNNDTIVLCDTAFEAHLSANSSVPNVVNSTAVAYDGTTANITGTAKVRSVVAINNNNNNGTSEYNVYIYDIKMNTGKRFRDVNSIVHYSGTVSGLTETNDSVFGIADIKENNAVLQDGQNKSLVFPVGQVGVKDVANGASYTFRNRVKGTNFSTAGQATITLTGDEEFPYADGALSSNQEKDFIIIPRENVNASAAVDTSVDVANSTTKQITNIDSTSDIKVGEMYFLSTDGPFQVRNIVNSTCVAVDTAPGTKSGVAMLQTFQNNYPISLALDSVANVTISSSGTVATIGLNKTLASTLSSDIIFDTKNTSSTRVGKTVTTTEVAIDCDSNDKGLTGPWSLGVVDAFKLVSVHSGTGAGTTDSSDYDGFSTDVTDEFEIVSGQKDGYYGLSKLRKKPGSTLAISAGDQFKVVFRHFVKGADQGFFTINSYPVDDANTANTAAVTTQEIPIFVSPQSGREFKLRDCIDFRPEVANTATEGGDCTDDSATINPSLTEQINEVNKCPAPDTTITANVTFYLPRKDRLLLKNRQIQVLEGQPATNPQLPAMPDGAMQLGTLDIPVYPSLSAAEARFYKRPDLGATIKATQLVRYTMEDIRSIDQRVTNLEYYSSLNFLEKFTTDKVLPGRTDPTTNRFKNGFIVDNFASLTTGNPLNTEFKAGFDTARNLLTARFENYSVPLQFKSGNRISRSNDLVFPRYMQRRIINQSRATRTRKVTNALWQYNGTVKLFPDYLAGVDNIKSPEAAVQIDIDAASGTLALIEELNKIAPQQFTREEVVADERSSQVVSQQVGDTQVTNTVEIVQTQQIRRSTTQLSARSRTTQRRVGDFVTDLAFQPYIPGTQIRFEAVGLRPGMRHYIWFDGRNVTSHCRPAGRVNPFDSLDIDSRLSSSRRRRMIRPKGSLGDALTADSSGRITGIFRVPANTFFAGEREFIVADVQNVNQLDEALSIANARFNCYNFSVTKGDVITSTRQALPSATTTQETFTRTRRDTEQVITSLPPAEITIVETPVNVPVPVPNPIEIPGPPITVPPEVVLVPNPIEVPVPGDPVLIPGPPIFIDPPIDIPPPPPPPPNDPPVPQTFTDGGIDEWDIPEFENGGRQRGRGGPDPLAQSFLIDPEQFGGSATGYLTGVDIYFSNKDRRRGVVVEIRETINGVPGKSVLPFSRTHLDASRVNTSATGLTKTTFEFTSPVQVNADTEYCVVILPDGNSPEYEVFTAKAGEKDLNTNIVNNQDWGTGTMFLSTNNRTWTEFVDEDLKFQIKAARFRTRSADVTLENEDLEFLQSNTSNINGSFTPGEEVFVNAANATGGVVVNKGNSTLKATSSNPINFTTLGIAAGDRIVLTSNTTTFDVVEVDSIANSSQITLRGAPTFSNATANVIFTPCAEMVQIDANTSTIMVTDSSATNSTFLFQNTAVIIGTESLANATINEVVDTNISYFEPRMYRNVPDGTFCDSSIKAKKNGSSGDQDHTKFEHVDRFYSPGPIKIMSRSNEIVNNSGNKSIEVNHKLSSRNFNLGACVDLQSQELFIYENIINNDSTDEHLGDAGSASCKYVSRRVELAEGLDAEDIKVFVNAYKPANTDIEVYAKVLAAEDPQDFDDKHWSKLQRVGLNKDKISSTKNRLDVVEYEFEFADAPDSTEVTGKAIVDQIGNTTITGSGTTYSSDFSAGDRVVIVNTSLDDQTDYFISTVTDVASDTEMTVADGATFATDGSVVRKVDSSHLNQVFRDPNIGASTDRFISTYYDSDNVKYTGYKILAIKIVMKADSTSFNPYLQDYRAIAVSL